MDEAVHYWWVLRILEAGEWLRPLNVGKPLEAWLAAPLIFLLGGDPLIIMRSLHVLAGLLTAILTFPTAMIVTSSPSRALLSAVLVALCPFVVYLERMALVEIYLCAGGLLSIMAILRFWQTSDWKRAVFVGLALVLTAFAKFPIGFIFALWLPLAIIVASCEERRRLLKPREVSLALGPVVTLFGLVLCIAWMRVRQGLPPGFGLGLLHQQSSYTEVETLLFWNLKRLLYELEAQLGWPALLLGVVGILISLVKGTRYQRWLAATGLLPWLGIVVIAREWSSRYLLFSIPPLVISAVAGWSSVLKSRWVKGVLVLIPLGFFSFQSVVLILDPPAARWSEGDRWGYIGGWPSGYGYAEAARYLCSSDLSLAVYTLEVGTAMQLMMSLPPGCQVEIYQLHVVDGNPVAPETRRSLLLEKCPALLVAPDALDPSDELIAHTEYVTGFSKPCSLSQVALYKCVSR